MRQSVTDDQATCNPPVRRLPLCTHLHAHNVIESMQGGAATSDNRKGAIGQNPLESHTTECQTASAFTRMAQRHNHDFKSFPLLADPFTKTYNGEATERAQKMLGMRSGWEIKI